MTLGRKWSPLALDPDSGASADFDGLPRREGRHHRHAAGVARRHIFGLLIAVMLTGMPISIALGLTVMTFVFTMTRYRFEAVALKLFTGIEKFEIMAIPFFILAGNFLTHGGVARRMIDFAKSLIGHLHGGLALAGIVAARCSRWSAARRSPRSSPSARSCCRRWSRPAPDAVRRGDHHGGRLARHPDAAIDPEGDLRHRDQTSIGALFVAGLLPGILLTPMLCSVTW